MPNKNEPPDNKNVELVIENIFGNPPNWLVRWGIFAIFLFLLACIAVASFVRYPDKLVLDIEIVSESPPVEILSKISGTIDSIYITDKQYAKKGEIVLQFSSTTNPKDWDLLNRFFYDFESIRATKDYLSLKLPESLKLGELSSDYANLRQLFSEFQSYLRQYYVFKKINAIENEIVYTEKLNHSIKIQQKYYTDEVDLVEKDYTRSKKLQQDSLISEVDKEKSQARLLQELRQAENFTASRINNDIKVQQLYTQINELKEDRAKGILSRIFDIQQIIDQIEAKYQAWEAQFVYRSPVDGIVSFNKINSYNQFAKTDEILFVLIPDVQASLIAFGNLNLKSSGSLNVGQKVIIDIENYPTAQFGSIEGKVKDYSIIPNNGSYLVTISLPQVLKTSQGKVLPQRQRMKGVAAIYTQEYNLLQRIFHNLNKATG
ncbi:MAG: HlyD family efflux transporter periplasmic adaptor subunit [Saprospiraceae bacterium]|nr:HlyD family efflux transporter periplasmic adaptor subunit [Saprospiraceae bacterium]MBP7679487.1 HlyD family efflux transporter periplasmic adaptor subunit [Saprospiraceae bacterium]